MTVREALKWGKRYLETREVEGAKPSADFLLRTILKKDKTYLLAHPDQKLRLLEESKFKSWIKRRGKHEPVWYIANKIEFFGQDLYVNRDVLIPRPETELIIERLIQQITKNKSRITNKNQSSGTKELKIVDIGTGSGAIILSVAKELEKVSNNKKQKTNNEYFASDISERALAVARKNAKSLFSEPTHPSCHSRERGNPTITFKKGDLFGPWVGQRFDIIVANLPYVPHEEMSTLAYDLLHYEPRTALDGGAKGIEIYQRFFDELPSFVNPGALIYCEIGDKQGDELEKMVKKTVPKATVKIVKDYADFERLVIIEIPA